MTDAPEADLAVDHELAARLVREQHPDLAGPLRLVASGWDNMVYRLGRDLAVRLPRRRIAVALIEHEQRWLPELAARLPLPIPAPVRVGRPSEEYPFPWSVVPWIEGRTVASIDPVDRRAIAGPLAEFLTALHVPAPEDAPFNPVRGRALAERDEVMRARFMRGEVPGSAELLALWEAGLAAPALSGPALWVHGDVHAANLVASEDAGPAGASGPVELVAVIDFGDLTAGDPASDLSVAWTAFDREGRERFRARLDELGHPIATDAGWARARAWAAGITGGMLETVSGDGPIARIARHALAELTSGD